MNKVCCDKIVMFEKEIPGQYFVCDLTLNFVYFPLKGIKAAELAAAQMLARGEDLDDDTLERLATQHMAEVSQKMPSPGPNHDKKRTPSFGPKFSQMKDNSQAKSAYEEGKRHEIQIF
jgi:hypothetical protein